MSIEHAVAEFVDGRSSQSFTDLALAIARLQYRKLPAYRHLWRARGLDPERLQDWTRVPPIPCSAFKELALHIAPPRITFRSSGTTRETTRSVHHHPFPDLYRLVIDRSFPAALLTGRLGLRPPMLSLIPPLEVAPDSSLSYMIDHVMTGYADPNSDWACGHGGVDVEHAHRWLMQRTRGSQPVLVLTTALALLLLLDWLEHQHDPLQLAEGSVIFETGGFKGREREVTREELLRRTEEGLGVAASQVVREYGMTELTSQAYSRPFEGGDPEVLYGPPWARYRILDPMSLAEVARGELGVISVFDLANVGSAVHVVTEDLGRAESDDGFRLLGRAAGAELRGCSLTVEELAKTNGEYHLLR